MFQHNLKYLLNKKCRKIRHLYKYCNKIYFLLSICVIAIICFIVFSIPSLPPSKNITLPFPYSAKFLMASTHILNKITLVSRLACFISLAAWLIPFATSSLNNATPCPRNCAASLSASAAILMALPSASAAFVFVINKACPSFSAAAFKLFDCYHFTHTRNNGFVKSNVVNLQILQMITPAF